MNIYKNFLNKEKLKSFKLELFNKEFPWYYRDKQTNKKNNTFYFTHCFMKDQKIHSDWYETFIKPIVEKIEATNILEIRANLVVNTGKKQKSGYHVDFPYLKNKTAILYMNTCNGYTMFKNKKKVTSEENKMIIFDGQLEHQGVSQTDTKRRIVINFNYY
jgi:hypothetical protein